MCTSHVPCGHFPPQLLEADARLADLIAFCSDAEPIAVEEAKKMRTALKAVRTKKLKRDPSRGSIGSSAAASSSISGMIFFAKDLEAAVAATGLSPTDGLPKFYMAVALGVDILGTLDAELAKAHGLDRGLGARARVVIGCAAKRSRRKEM